VGSWTWPHGGAGLGSRQWMPGALVKRAADWGRCNASGSVGLGSCPRLLLAGAQAWTRAVASVTVAASPPMRRASR
jgi:hypothetical protein